MPLQTFQNIFDVTKYPAGESHVEMKPGISEFPDKCTIIHDSVRGWEDLMNVIIADEILKRLNVFADWFIPYFPFGREDRRRSARSGQELVFAIDSLNRSKVRVIIADPHSEVSAILHHIDQAQAVLRQMENHPHLASYIPCVPDAGAQKKAYSWLWDEPVIGSKQRDVNTGKLSGFDFSYPDDISDKDILIVDDICDGGGTFIGLAKLLKEEGARTVALMVTQGLFTKGTTLDHIDEIYTYGERRAGVKTLPWTALLEGAIIT